MLARVCAQSSRIDHHDAVVVCHAVPRHTRAKITLVTQDDGVRPGRGLAAEEALGVVADVVVAGDEELAVCRWENAAEAAELGSKAGGKRV